MTNSYQKINEQHDKSLKIMKDALDNKMLSAMTTPTPDWRKEFDDEFVWKDDVFDPIAQLIGLPRKDWRPTFGLPEREISAIKSFIEKVESSAIERTVRECIRVVESFEPSPELEKYVDLVKNGNKDDMYDYGVKLERDSVVNHLSSLLPDQANKEDI